MISCKPKALSCKRSKPDATDLARGCRAKAYRQKLNAFTLLEVVVALGIFAIGMVAVLGLFSPVAKSVGDSADAEAATRVADLLNVKLQAQGAVAVAKLLKVSTSKTAHQLTTSDASTNYDITKDAQLLFASRDGTKIGLYGDPVWIDPATGRPSDLDKYFEVALIRNEAVSPNVAALDVVAPMLAYSARVRWPAFVLDPTPTNNRKALPLGYNPSATVSFDHSQKQVLFFSGAITR